MKNIDWNQLEKNSESKEIGFEQLCFQIAYRKYASLGDFEYYYNTPGSEFYLTLKRDSEELNLREGDVVGWQAKFWRNKSDEDNSPLDKNHRDELIEGFDKTLSYKSNLKKWIICTPGKFSNTAPHIVVDKLESELSKINDKVIIDYWHKDIYLAFALEDTGFYGTLFNHFFSTKFIGYEYIKSFSEKKIDRLKEKFDIDLYIENEIDKHIAYIIEPEKVQDRLRNILSSAARYIKSQRNNVLDKHPVFKYIDNEYFSNVRKLAEARCKLIEDIYDSLGESYDSNLIASLINGHRNDFAEIVSYLNAKLKNKSYFLRHDEESGDYQHETFIHNNYFEFVQKVSGFLFIRPENEKSNVEYFLNLSNISDIHVFGSAGYGKTNLACAICKKHLDNQIPALLILGSNIRDTLSPQDQILASLDLKNEFSFKDLLFALNFLGEQKKCKVPIIIDGLNESIPTAKVWKEALPDIIYDIRSFKNILLITTLRDGYVYQVFGKESYSQVDNNYKIDGFNNYNVRLAINRYFKKYNISSKGQFDENLFKNPLLLKVFCEANKGVPNASITQNSIYKSIEDYVTSLIIKVSEGDPIRKRKASKGLELISQRLWVNNSRNIPYPEDYISLIDEGIETFEKSVSHAMMDEGMFFLRNFDDVSENIQFTYDLIAGYCIAKYHLLKGKRDPEVALFLQSDDFKKIIQLDNAHPLAEDILKAIFYLVPNQCNGKQLYEFENSGISLVDYILNIDILSQNGDGRKELRDFFTSQSFNNNEIDLLCGKVLAEIVERNSFSNVDILFSCYFNWSGFQRDTFWNEKTRKNVWKILEVLKQISRSKYLKGLTVQELYNHLLFCTLLFSSTDNELRNNATKVAVAISELNSKLILRLLQISIGLTDLYILERITATLCGVVLRLKDKSFTIECCEYLQNIFLPQTTTNHVVILDYIETILDFGKHHYNYPFSDDAFLRNSQELWGTDKAYMAELTKHKYFEMGYDIFDYDFVKSQVQHFIDEGRIRLTYKDIFSMLHYRCTQHGYDKELYLELETKLAEEQKYRRDDDMDSRENYLFKYLWTSYYELIGYLLINGLIERENNSRFRFDDIMVDPTFPQLPSKVQLVNSCFLPLYNENVQDWINCNRNDYLEEIYCTNLSDEDDEWILLNAKCSQEETVNNSKQRITISVDSLTYNSLVALNRIKNPRFCLNTNVIHNIYAGELPWRTYTSEEYTDDHDSNVITSVTQDYSFLSWSGMRSYINKSFPFLYNEIAQYLNLYFNPSDLSYYSGNEKVTKYIWADGGKFYFMKKSFLTKYLSDNNLKFVHYKYIAKYGDLGGMYSTKKFNPAYKDIKALKLLDI